MQALSEASCQECVAETTQDQTLQRFFLKRRRGLVCCANQKVGGIV
jgi:hypothetical protein